jgi:hypothetical protein
MILASTDAVAFAALAVVHGNGASAEIAEMLHLTEQVLPTPLQILGLLHGASNLNDYKHSDIGPKKKKRNFHPRIWRTPDLIDLMLFLAFRARMGQTSPLLLQVISLDRFRQSALQGVL